MPNNSISFYFYFFKKLDEMVWFFIQKSPHEKYYLERHFENCITNKETF